jgi:hypothetical protein
VHPNGGLGCYTPPSTPPPRRHPFPIPLQRCHTSALARLSARAAAWCRPANLVPSRSPEERQDAVDAAPAIDATPILAGWSNWWILPQPRWITSSVFAPFPAHSEPHMTWRLVLVSRSMPSGKPNVSELTVCADDVHPSQAQLVLSGQLDLSPSQVQMAHTLTVLSNPAVACIEDSDVISWSSFSR